MIKVNNLKSLLSSLNFEEKDNTFRKMYSNDASIVVDFKKCKISYLPLDDSFAEGDFPSKIKTANGFIIHRDTTLNFSSNENFVCLVCVHLLLEKGYSPNHIVIEPSFPSGGSSKPCYGDVMVFDKEYNPLVLIENKTYGAEFSKEWNLMQKEGGQLFSYLGNMSKILEFPSHIILFSAEYEEGKFIYKNHIITLKDNEGIVKEGEKNKNIKLFSNQRGLLFEVWNETYGKAFETKGMFEDDIIPYTIGKAKYTINDLKELTHAEIKPIYHEFATILRNNAITDFEHSFYILIDLFLCKITDERKNPNDLQFYYKGVTRDNPKEYCGRLLKLYKQGKKELFQIDVINKEEEDIKKIFEDKDRPLNGLYQGIKEFFEDIKYYNIKKFNFISVENKEEFEKNFQIIIKVAALIQDINLTSSETNHFFGDLFEGLLSKNVHQTEGQFFTPLPIVNFIIRSLPDFSGLNKLKVLDYACGAGHFLTEFTKLYNAPKLFGIEKNQNLSQVAKIATIINGNTDVNIIFKDALSYVDPSRTIDKDFAKDSFDLIIANPPYSVKGFLDTLEKKDYEEFELIKYIDEKSFIKNNAIECFFIERAGHFLKDKGIFAIVLPSSILDNGNIAIKTREYLFKHFNILSIVALNNRTFGSTGTNTIILIAQKVEKNAEGLVDTLINNKDYTQYKSFTAIYDYAEMQGYNNDEFINFMKNNILTDSLEDNEIFKEYRTEFKTKQIQKKIVKDWFVKSTFYNNSFKDNSKEYKKAYDKFINSEEYFKLENEYNKMQFIVFAKEIEIEKLITYIELHNNNVAVLLSPPMKVNNKTNKEAIIEFLGYDWSSSKGNEGIKYQTEEYIKENEEDDNGNEEFDKEIDAVNSINYIKTPLYNPHDIEDNSKYAYAIRQHIYDVISTFTWGKNSIKLEKDYIGDSELFRIEQLNNMIDYSRAKFERKVFIGIKIPPLIFRDDVVGKKLGEVCDIKIGGTPSRENESYFKGNNLWVSISEMRGQIITNTNEKLSDKGVKDSNVKLIKKGTTLLSFKLSIGKTAIAGADLYTNEAIAALIPKDTNIISDKYLFQLFSSRLLDLENVGNKAFGKSLNSDYLKNDIRIPVPSMNEQEILVSQCEIIDKNINLLSKEISIIQNKINSILISVSGVEKKIGELYFVSSGATPSRERKSFWEGGTIPWVKTGELNNDILIDTEEKITDKGLENSSATIFPKGSIVVAMYGMTIGQTAKLGIDATTNQACAVLFKKKIEIDEDFVWYSIMNKIDDLKELGHGKGQPNLNADDVKNFKIIVPSIDKQKQIVKDISLFKKEIALYYEKINTEILNKREIFCSLLKKE